MAELRETFRCDGAVRLRALVKDELAAWHKATAPFFALGKPGHRIARCGRIAELAKRISQSEGFEGIVGTGWRCVRAIAFNKTPDANWSLGWHQDRTIAVVRREDVAGFNVWSSKDDVIHVEPPFSFLERMVTLRVHLDPVEEGNAPLLIARGSHRLGKVAESTIQTIVDDAEIFTSRAKAGDGWLYATPVLHASARSRSAGERRVIHLDFSRDALPTPLEWAGIGPRGHTG